MAGGNESLRTRETLDREERYFLDVLAKQEQTIAKLKRKRRRRIVQRSLSLFGGIVTALFGIINMIFIQALDGNFKNTLIFVVAALVAIPLLRYGMVLFHHKMPVDHELTAAADEVVHTQYNLNHVREERLAIMRNPVKGTRSVGAAKTTSEAAPEPVRANDETAGPLCPDCGNPVREGAKICRTCGHLFV